MKSIQPKMLWWFSGLFPSSGFGDYGQVYGSGVVG